MRLKNTLCVLVTVLLLAGLIKLAAGRQARGAAVPAATETPAPQATQTPVSASVGKLVISELAEKNKTLVADEDGDFSDWIELYNTGDETLELTGWRIADGPEEKGWIFPQTRLPGGDRMLVFASKKDRSGSILHTNFGLSAGESVWLWDSEGLPVDRAETGDGLDDVSMARGESGDWAPSRYPTPGYENSRAGYERYQQTLWPDGALVINEVSTASFERYYSGYSKGRDWVEIKNVSDAPVWLGDYYLSDNEDDRLRCRLPEQSLAAGGLLRLYCSTDSASLPAEDTVLPLGLNSAEEQLYLSDADGRLLDRVSLRAIPFLGSYGRRDGEPGFFYFDTPSPGEDNEGGARFISVMPDSPTPDGVYEGVDAVEVTLSGAGTIFYTLDGSAPTAESTRYTGPLRLEETCVLRAIAVEGDCLPSPVLTRCFFINEGHHLPVVSLVADRPAHFRLMYDGGHKGIEMPGALSFYRDGERFSINCGVSMNGETSLSERKKNMALRFRSVYGQQALEYDLFGGGVTHFTNLLLRAGQDQNQAIIRNELAQELCAQTDCRVINQRSLYCALYLNGQYAGLYTVKEKANEQLYADLCGVSRESVELEEAPIPFGSSNYAELVDFPFRNDMTLPENYARYCEIVDIDSLIDWVILEGFCSNTDITMGNVRYVRSDEADGKWHFMFYDLDAAFRFTGSMYYNLMTEYSAQNVQISGVIVPLMHNAVFRDRFLRRAEELLSGPLTNEAILREIDRLAAEIAPEVPRDRALINLSAANWEESLQSLRSLIRDSDWRQENIEALCRVFDLDEEDRALYFGQIDGK